MAFKNSVKIGQLKIRSFSGEKKPPKHELNFFWKKSHPEHKYSVTFFESRNRFINWSQIECKIEFKMQVKTIRAIILKVASGKYLK